MGNRKDKERKKKTGLSWSRKDPKRREVQSSYFSVCLPFLPSSISIPLWLIRNSTRKGVRASTTTNPSQLSDNEYNTRKNLSLTIISSVHYQPTKQKNSYSDNNNLLSTRLYRQLFDQQTLHTTHTERERQAEIPKVQGPGQLIMVAPISNKIWF